MHLITLPDDIFPENPCKTDDLIFHYYKAGNQTFYGKSILKKNSVSLVISGKKCMHFAEKKVEIYAHEIHLLSTGNCLISMEMYKEVPFQSILIFFSNTLWANFLAKYQPQAVFSSNATTPGQQPFLTFEKDSFIETYISSLQSLLEANASISAEMKTLKFEELMLYLLEKDPARFLSFQSLKSAELQDIELKKVLESNITTHISIEDLAFLCNNSVSTFKRRCLKIYGTSPGKWILQRRMELAREMLLFQKERPSDVFYKVGYENHSSFSQAFKQTFGTTPKEFYAQQLNV